MTAPFDPEADLDVEAPLDFEAVIDTVAPLVGLDVAPDHRAGVAANLRLAAAMAALVLAEPAGDHDEPAPVFRPEARRG